MILENNDLKLQPTFLERINPDITSKYLEAAIIDQKVAGLFHDRVYAFVAPTAKKGGWILGVAIANEPGYNATNITFASEQEAREWARGLNEHLGLSWEKALRIVTSTMWAACPYWAAMPSQKPNLP